MAAHSSGPAPFTVLRGHISDVQALAILDDKLLFSGYERVFVTACLAPGTCKHNRLHIDCTLRDAEGLVHLWDMEERRSFHNQA